MPIFDQSSITSTPLYSERNVRIWSHFPGIVATTTGRFHGVAGLYLYYLQQEKKKGRITEPAKELRYRLLKKVEERIIQMDEDDEFVVLAV